MNVFDVFIVIILSFCLIRGSFRGLIKELSSIIGILTGFYIAYTYYPLGERYILENITQASYANILSFAIIFIGTIVIITFLGILIRYFLDIVFLGWVDHVFGACFGLIKGILFASVLLTVLTIFLDDESSVVKDSRLSPHISQCSETLICIVPTEIKDIFLLKINNIQESWNGE